MLYLRMKRPTLVIRGSFSNLTKAFFCCFRLFFNNCFSVVMKSSGHEKSLVGLIGGWGSFGMSLLILCFFPVLIQGLEFLQAFVRIHVHGTEFEEIKYVVITSDSFGFIYNRTFTFDPDGKCRYNQKRERQIIAVPEKRMSNVLFHQGSLNLRGLF